MEIDLEDVTPLAPGEIAAESIRQWRADCQVGQFKVGSSDQRGAKLDMEIIGAQFSEGEFFGYPYQQWLALLFVDPDAVVSTILLKKESLDNFSEIHRKYRIAGESLLGKILRANMSKRSSRKYGGTYYAVEFEVVGPGKYVEAVAKFRKIRYQPEMLRLTNVTEPTK